MRVKEIVFWPGGIDKTPWDINLAIEFIRERLEPGDIFSMPTCIVPEVRANLHRDQPRLLRHDLVEGGGSTLVDDTLDRLESGDVSQVALEDEPSLLAIGDAQRLAAESMQSYPTTPTRSYHQSP